MMKFMIVLGLFLAGASAACDNPKVQASSYTPADSQVLSAIPFIAEFTLNCSNDEKPVLYADIEGTFVPVVTSADGSKYQVSWIKELKTGDYNVDLYDSDGYAAAKRSRDRGDASTAAPLVTIVVSYPGSYGGPWLNSEESKKEELYVGLYIMIAFFFVLVILDLIGVICLCKPKVMVRNPPFWWIFVGCISLALAINTVIIIVLIILVSM